MTLPEPPSTSTKNGATGTSYAAHAVARHHDRDVVGRELADHGDALLGGALGDDDEARVTGDLELPRRANTSQKRWHVPQPLERNASSVRCVAPVTAMLTAACVGGGSDDVDRDAARATVRFGDRAPTAHDRCSDRTVGAPTAVSIPSGRAGSRSTPSWWSARRISAWLRAGLPRGARGARPRPEEHDEDGHRGEVTEPRDVLRSGRPGCDPRQRVRSRCAARAARGGTWRRRAGSRSSSRA